MLWMSKSHCESAGPHMFTPPRPEHNWAPGQRRGSSSFLPPVAPRRPAPSSELWASRTCYNNTVTVRAHKPSEATLSHMCRDQFSVTTAVILLHAECTANSSLHITICAMGKFKLTIGQLSPRWPGIVAYVNSRTSLSMPCVSPPISLRLQYYRVSAKNTRGRIWGQDVGSGEGGPSVMSA